MNDQSEKKAITRNDEGVRLMQDGAHRQALEAFEAALSINPGFEAARRNRAGVLFALGDVDAATAASEEFQGQRCENCGTENRAGALFCGRCGAPFGGVRAVRPEHKKPGSWLSFLRAIFVLPVYEAGAIYLGVAWWPLGVTIALGPIGAAAYFFVRRRPHIAWGIIAGICFWLLFVPATLVALFLIYIGLLNP